MFFHFVKGDAQVGFFSAKKIKNEETGEEFFELESLGVSEASEIKELARKVF